MRAFLRKTTVSILILSTLVKHCLSVCQIGADFYTNIYSESKDKTYKKTISQQIITYIKMCLDNFGTINICITGHSMGGALAQIASLNILEIFSDKIQNGSIHLKGVFISSPSIIFTDRDFNKIQSLPGYYMCEFYAIGGRTEKWGDLIYGGGEFDKMSLIIPKSRQYYIFLDDIIPTSSTTQIILEDILAAAASGPLAPVVTTMNVALYSTKTFSYFNSIHSLDNLILMIEKNSNNLPFTTRKLRKMIYSLLPHLDN